MKLIVIHFLIFFSKTERFTVWTYLDQRFISYRPRRATNRALPFEVDGDLGRRPPPPILLATGAGKEGAGHPKEKSSMRNLSSYPA